MAVRLSRLALSVKIALQALISPVAYAACALIVREGKVLLVRHSYVKGWLLPGGGVGRGEPAETALLREMREEIGLTACAPPRFFGLYTRKSGWATNVIVLFRIDDAQFSFIPNFEVREVVFADPLSPPENTPPSVRRRLRELAGVDAASPYW